MTDLWKRNAKITLKLLGQESIQFGDLRVKFSIVKDSTQDENVATFVLYNLAESTRKKYAKKDTEVNFEWGYSGLKDIDPFFVSYDTLFTGEVTNPTPTERQGTEILTTLKCGDTHSLITNLGMSISLKEGSASVTKILMDIVGEVKANGYGIAQDFYKVIKDIVREEKNAYKNGVALEGKVNKILQTVLDKVGYKHSFQNGNLTVYKLGEPISPTAVLLSPSTGLLDVPKQKEFDVRVGEENKKVNGLEIKSLIVPGIEPGRLVTVESRDYTGVVIVQKASIVGDTFGGTSTITAEALEYNPI